MTLDDLKALAAWADRVSVKPIDGNYYFECRPDAYAGLVSIVARDKWHDAYQRYRKNRALTDNLSPREIMDKWASTEDDMMTGEIGTVEGFRFIHPA